MECKICGQEMGEIHLHDEDGEPLHVAEYECICGMYLDCNGDWIDKLKIKAKEVEELTKKLLKRDKDDWRGVKRASK